MKKRKNINKEKELQTYLAQTDYPRTFNKYKKQLKKPNVL